MQVSAINSTNFKGLLPGDTDYSENLQNQALQSKLGKFEAKVAKIKANVRPETCIFTAAAIILSVVKGKKIADVAVKAVALGQSFIHAGLKKASGSVVSAVKGLSKKDFDKQKYLQGIKNATSEILERGKQRAENVGKPNEKFVNNVKEYVNVFCKDNQETGNKISEFITEKMGINSKGGLLTGILAGAFGWRAGDGSGDALETMLDNKEIKKEYEKIFKEYAA